MMRFPSILLALAALASAGLASGPSKPADALLVVNRGADTAMLFEPEGNSPAWTFETGSGPHEAAASPDGSLAVVCVYGTQQPNNKLLVVDLKARKIVQTIDLGEYRRPHGSAWMKDNRHVLVTCEMEQAVIKVDTKEGKVVQAWKTGQRGSHMLALSPDEKTIYTANIPDASVSVIDVAGDATKPRAIVATAPGCEGIAISPDGKFVWTSNRSAGNVSVIDTDSLKVVATLEASGVPIRVAISPAGKHAIVTRPNAGLISVFDAAEKKLIKELDTKPGAGVESEPLPAEGPNAGKDAPMGVTFSPRGDFAYVCNLASGTVAVIDMSQLQVVGHKRAGAVPDGIAAF